MSRRSSYYQFDNASSVLWISAPEQFTGRSIVLECFLGSTKVNPVWSIQSGGQSASINQNGKLTVNEGVTSATVVVQASYGNQGATADIVVSYDNQLTIEGPDTITGTQGNLIARYNSTVVTDLAQWSVVTGDADFTEGGSFNFYMSGGIVVQASYGGLTAVKALDLVYETNSSTETTIDPETGTITETTTTTEVDPETGETTTTETIVVTNDDGSSSETQSETVTQEDGSSVTNSQTQNSDGTSSESQTTVSAPDPNTGSVTTESQTTNYDENGNTTGSQASELTENVDGSSTSTTTNFDPNGDPTDTTNQDTDTEGNVSTQNIDYDENGDPVVTGYNIDTSDGDDGNKNFNGDGVNTEFYGFDATSGFVMRMHFTIDFNNQPANQDQSHHQILTMKRAYPEPWYGFQLRQSNTTKKVMLGTQFSTGSNTNTEVIVGRTISSSVYEYDLEITYDPTASDNNFVCKELITNRTVLSQSKVFPDIPELEYLTVCIGYGLDSEGTPYRFSNINVLDFSIVKLYHAVAEPVIACDGTSITITCDTDGASIYYKLNNTGDYVLYSAPIAISVDTDVEAYAVKNGIMSTTAFASCTYEDGIEEPIIVCDGEEVTITCNTPSVTIYYRIEQEQTWHEYDYPIPINDTVLVYSYATVDDLTSDVVSATCTYSPIVLNAPVISCDGTSVTITCSTPGAEIFYRTDPTAQYEQYYEPFAITEDTTVYAYSSRRGSNSTVVTENCTYVPSHDYSQDYLSFVIRTDGNIVWKALGSGYARTIEYSINGGAWTSITSVADPGVAIRVHQGETVRFRGTNSTYAGSKANYSGFDGSSAMFDIEGNIMSLIAGDSFTSASSMTGSYNFCSLFKKSNAVSAENLVLPCTTLTQYCYRAMFSECAYLTEAPELPATTLAQGCYWYMFECCLITSAPELNATTLVKECYGHMFVGCTNLNYIKCMATTGFSTSNCLQTWVGQKNAESTQGVAYNGTFVKDGNTTWTIGVSGIPTSWTVCNDVLLLSPTISYDGETVEIACETQGAVIYYRLGQSGSFSVYSEPITLSATTMVEAYSTASGQTSSVISQNCVYVEETPLEASNKSLDRWTYNNRSVTVPYSINALDGKTSSYNKGTFNFETSVNLKSAQPTYLWFGHADQSATVYVDNVLVEKHWGGYTSFFTDISEYVHRGTNVIKVAVKNNEGNNLAPAAGDFNFNATLGKVKLLTSPVLPDPSYGYDGFHIDADVTDSEAGISVRTKVPEGADVKCIITDDDGYSYMDTQTSDGDEMVFRDTIVDPVLWNGTDDPHLYTITIEISKDGDLYHRFSRPYGLRYWDYVYGDTSVLQSGEPYTGFLLNGSPYYLRGVCMHDDLAGKANALSDSDYAQEFAIIQELGCNFLRLAHYPHPKEVYDWCDQLGIIVQTEAPCVNKLQSTMPSDYYTHLDTQYTDMVTQHYNHPSILFWGLSNETTTDDKAFAKAKIEYYTDLIKDIDPYRWVGYVMSHSYNNPSGYYNNPDVDWFGGNIYTGWYIDKSSNDPTSQLNQRISNTITALHKPLAFSEYGCGGTQHCHSDEFLTTTTKGNYERHDIEYMMWLHEGHIAALRNFPQLLFTAEWQLFDIAVSNRNEGYTVCLDGETTSVDDNLRRLNNKGLVERDHTTKKDPFYIYKAEWNPTPFVHICGKDYLKTEEREIKCYTNDGDTLTMYLGNSSTPYMTADVHDHIAVFEAVDYTAGTLIRVEGDTETDSFTIGQ